MLETARTVDGPGFDLIGVQDHPYQARHLDTSSLLAAILAQAASVRVFAAVANLPLRPPAMLAKAAATLDLLGPPAHWPETLTHFALDLGFHHVPARRPTRPRHARRLHRRRCAGGSRTRRGAACLLAIVYREERMTAPVLADRPETARGRMVYEALLAIHGLIRRDLARVSASRRASWTGFRRTTSRKSSRS